MKKNINFTIDDIVKQFNKNIKDVKSRKFDGITIECTLKNISLKSTKIDDIKTLCQNLNIMNYSFEDLEDNENIFIVQFPEFINTFSEEQLKDLYIMNFKWILDNLIDNDRTHAITKNFIREQRYIFIKQAISIYYRSYVNQYKESIQDYLNEDFYNKIETIFIEYLSEYAQQKGISNV